MYFLQQKALTTEHYHFLKNEYNITLDPSLLSNYLLERRTGKNADMVLEACDKIVTAKEKECLGR